MYKDITFHFTIWDGKHQISTHESFWMLPHENIHERIKSEMDYHIEQFRKYNQIDVKKYFITKAFAVETDRIVEIDIE
jgi:hypothetical protein